MTQKDRLFTTEAALQMECEGLKNLISKKDEKISYYEEEVERLYEIIRELKRHRFGPRKERWETEEQACLFNEAEIESKKLEDEDEGSNETKEEVQVPSYTRKRGKRKPLPKDLPREVVVLDLPEEEKVAEDGTPLRVIGKEISEKLFYEPAQMKVIEYHRLRYEGT